MKLIINHEYENKKELKEIVKAVAEIEKEHSCNCTLKLKNSIRSFPLLGSKDSALEKISQALQSTVYDTLQASDKK
ncbi:hypothetical protein [Peptoniphilus catoniae]|uniref:hypothetical protein n=1 Tax=Peptoniphilus catoniae TaxID=1660341 RepID=UPI0010FE639D|nr:hypothetical protein [Peptoniphilus catoniae]